MSNIFLLKEKVWELKLTEYNLTYKIATSGNLNLVENSDEIYKYSIMI